MGKYDPLEDYLRSSKWDELRLNFGEIEDILGCALPNSAYAYPMWWHNAEELGGERHVQADAWARAGYRTEDLDLDGQSVTFCRIGLPEEERTWSGRPPKRTGFLSRLFRKQVSFDRRTGNALVDGREFCFVQELIPECDERGRVLTYRPQWEFRNRERLPLLPEGEGEFCRFSIDAPARAGVYLWMDGKEILYIGETVDLRRRFNAGYGHIVGRNCYAGGQSTNCRMNKAAMEYYERGRPVALYFHETYDHKELELELLSKFRTKYNIKDN